MKISQTSIKELFLLDPTVIYLNHGSFGALPRAVLAYRRALEDEVEMQPVRFIQRELFDRLEQARSALGFYLQADPRDLALIPNATYAVNLVARSLDLGPGDEVLTTDQEYGACENTLRFVCQKRGAHLVRTGIPAPALSDEEIVEAIWRGVNDRTRFILLSHLTSATATIFPVGEIARRAREAGILVMVDGAHAPGQISLNLDQIDADFYTGNCHKWMLSPLGSAFLYTRREVQAMIEPLVVSWGWSGEWEVTTGSAYLDNLQWWGTYDPTAVLSIPAAIRFMDEHNWDAVAEHCREMLRRTLKRLDEDAGIKTISIQGTDVGQQMASIDISPVNSLERIKTHLYDRYRIEIPCLEWGGKALMRVSVQGYNSENDLELLLEAIQDCLAWDRRV
jgi:isopenicillin-N epimerase